MSDASIKLIVDSIGSEWPKLVAEQAAYSGGVAFIFGMITLLFSITGIIATVHALRVDKKLSVDNPSGFVIVMSMVPMLLFGLAFAMTYLDHLSPARTLLIKLMS